MKHNKRILKFVFATLMTSTAGVGLNFVAPNPASAEWGSAGYITQCVPTIRAGSEFAIYTSLKTCSGYQLDFQGDGNLVLYNPQKQAVWGTGTNSLPYSRKPNRLVMGRNGVFALYRDSTPVWQSIPKRDAISGSFIDFQEDGNLVMYSPSNTVVWATNTDNK